MRSVQVQSTVNVVDATSASELIAAALCWLLFVFMQSLSTVCYGILWCSATFRQTKSVGAKRKYNVSRNVDQQWIFGLYDTNKNPVT